MKQILFLLFLVLITSRVLASWYWPFGSDDDNKPPRMSELMEEASIMIDEASSLANQNKITEAVEKYKEAFAELERLELENPVRAATSEFSTVRNKKAYISAAIDSLLLDQASNNVRAVSVTDTTEIEKKYNEELEAKKKPVVKAVEKPEPLKVEKVSDKPRKNEAKKDKKELLKKVLKKDPKNRKVRVMIAAEDIRNKDYSAAELTIKELLNEKPNDITALNLKAALEMSKGNYKAAKQTLHQLITSNPKEYSGYYNLARLILKTEGESGKATAGRYYETGYKYYGGPRDEKIEEMLR